jgi:DNA-binding transcriptional regulator YhcF (GntR family)
MEDPMSFSPKSPSHAGLSGKLPGERSLAKRFHVNAKTLSKALTDLAAEGLLDRSIGRGTFVKGHAPTTVSLKRWLVVCDAAQADWELIQMLRAIHPELDMVTDVDSIRPSFLNQFSAVLNLTESTPDAFLRDLVVRNIPVVVVGREPRTYSTHAVVFDAPLALAQLGRDLLLSGHRHMAAVESQQQSVVTRALRKAAARYAPDAKIDTCVRSDAAAMVSNGVTAFVCENIETAAQVKAQLEKLGISIPFQASLSAVGSAPEIHPFSGYFVHPSEEVNAIVQLLNETQSYRPTTLWLAGHSVDHGTICSVPADPAELRMRYGSAGA